ncbi:unnamed protein product, partial [Mesorhabditis belari]|uniref:Protein kinase domain-containing protein n=1 Tax=Mesorhabditis belari TaxID=2138241 RepID=A0AAF3EFX0_9BILA
MTSDESVPKPRFQKGDMIAGWKVVQKLGEGGFGMVVEVVNRHGLHAACKAEFYTGRRDNQLIKKEVPILRLMQWSKHFCKIHLAGQTTTDVNESLNVIVMTLVGEPLSRIRRQCPSQAFTRSTAVRLLKQCLEAIRDLHYTGYLHRDVKGGNFAWHEESRTVYLIDMGFVRQYIVWKDEEKTEVIKRPIRKKAHFLGTSRYVSLNVHLRKDQGRRDDLWGLVYLFVEFIKGKLPWHDDNDRVTTEKKAKIGSKLLKGCPVEMYKFYDHVRCLGVEDKPNYDLLMNILEKICARCDYRDEDRLDFERGGRYYEYIMDNKENISNSHETTSITGKGAQKYDDESDENNEETSVTDSGTTEESDAEESTN